MPIYNMKEQKKEEQFQEAAQDFNIIDPDKTQKDISIIKKENDTNTNENNDKENENE